MINNYLEYRDWLVGGTASGDSWSNGVETHPITEIFQRIALFGVWEQQKLERVITARTLTIEERLAANLDRAMTMFDPDNPAWDPQALEVTDDYFNGKVCGYDVGLADVQGKRPSMEDTHVVKTIHVNGQAIPLFGVFDGHDGDQMANFTAEKIHLYLEEELVCKDPWQALKGCFKRLHAEFLPLHSGTTATVAMILDGYVWVANCGDSRTVLVENKKAVNLSEDAKPETDRYRDWIERHGGTVQKKGALRLNGILSVARALGDNDVGNGLSCTPKITRYKLHKGCSYLILACDGLWDVASSKQATQVVLSADDPCQAAINLVSCAIGNDSADNVTAMVVKL